MSSRTALLASSICIVVLARVILSRPAPANGDRLSVIPEDSVNLDNDLYEEQAWSQHWHHPHNPLLSYNAARVPYFAQKLVRLGQGTVLDVGCGAGLMTEALARKIPGLKFVGLDLSPASIRSATKHAEEQGVTNVAYETGSAYKLPYPDLYFDGVVSSDVIEHMYDLHSYTSEIARVLKPGGVFVFDTINRTWQSNLISYWFGQRILRFLPKDAHHPALFVTPEEMTTLLEAHGFDVADRNEMHGMQPSLRPLRFLSTVWNGGSVRDQTVRWSFVGDWVATSDISQSYGWYAIKR